MIGNCVKLINMDEGITWLVKNPVGCKNNKAVSKFVQVITNTD